MGSRPRMTIAEQLAANEGRRVLVARCLGCNELWLSHHAGRRWCSHACARRVQRAKDKVLTIGGVDPASTLTAGAVVITDAGAARALAVALDGEDTP